MQIIFLDFLKFKDKKTRLLLLQHSKTHPNKNLLELSILKSRYEIYPVTVK